MKQVLPLALGLTVGLIAPTRAADTRPATPLKENTPVEIVGRIHSAPKAPLGKVEHRMQVAVGPEQIDYTLHFRDAALYDLGGQEIKGDRLKDGEWVYARGWMMDDPRRIRVTEVRVIGQDVASLKGTPYFREGYAKGYLVANDRLFTGPAFSEGMPVVVVGRISSPPKRIEGVAEERKMQVAVGPEKTDYTLHLRDADLYGFHGRKIEESDLKDGAWVRAEGRVMKDPRRVQVSRLQVLGDREKELRSSAFYRSGYDQGYVMSVAGSRETFPKSDARFAAAPVTLVGRVTDDTGPLDTNRRIRVEAAGNEWTLHVTDNARVMNEAGKKISIHEVHTGQWVRARGWQTGDLRMRAFNVEELGADDAFRTSKVYRQDAPAGYVDLMLGNRTEFAPITLRGTVVSLEPVYGYCVVRDSENKTHRVYGDDVLITGPGGAAILLDKYLHPGDVISIEGRTIDLDTLPDE